MSTQKVISYADLSYINSALRNISSDVTRVNSEVGTISVKQNHLEGQLVKLADILNNFIKADIKQKNLQLAETRQGNLKQDLQIKFGYYAEVRRMATGILQALDTGVVSEDTLKVFSEEVMIKAPGYWLAPVLVALAAWVRNDKNITDKALAEALKRDDYKTTLFFMLVMRRLSRTEAGLQWLERYFIHQNPHNLNREFIVILEAVTTGVFPPAARQLMLTYVKNWLDQLTQGDTFIDEQKVQWVSFFEIYGTVEDDVYPLLTKYATNWDDLKTSLKRAKAHELLNNHFKGVISSSADFSKGLKVQLDEILSMLVTNFDDDELPLQEKVRLNHLIIEMDGDKDSAKAKMDSEKFIFEKQINFLQLLTNASFNPELSGATKVTQSLALSISQPWVIEAYDTFTAQSRNNIPQDVKLNIDGFIVSTKNGSDETTLLENQKIYYQNVLATELSLLKFPYASIIFGGLICLGGVFSVAANPIIGLIVLALGGILIWNALSKHANKKKTIADNVIERENKAREVLRGSVAETVDYRSEHSTEDAKAENVRDLLASITPENFSSVSKDAARSII